MIKYYPFYDYQKSNRDGLSFDNAIYYSNLSEQGYVNDVYENITIDTKYGSVSYPNTTQKLTHYFLIDFQRNAQYFIEIQKYFDQNDYIMYPFKFSICKTDTVHTEIASWQQQIDDYYGYQQSMDFYLKINNNNIAFYTKKEVEQENDSTNIEITNMGSFVLEEELQGSDRFYVVIYPNIVKFKVTPKPKKFTFKQIKKLNVNNDYNRQQGIFIKKNSDIQSIGLKTNKILPKSNLVFYFDFQNIESYRDGYDCVTDINSVYGNFTLRSVSWLDYGRSSYFHKIDGIKSNGIYLYPQGQIYCSNFSLNKKFNEFTLACYINKYISSNYSDNYNLLTFGYYADQYYNEYSQEYDQSNANKGFGFFVNYGKIGLRLNDKAFIIGDVSIPYRQWCHIAMTYDGLCLRGYINGQLKLQQFLNQSIIDANKFYIGSTLDNYNSGYGNGWWSIHGYKLDQLALYDKCLDQKFISTVYKNKVTL